LRSHCIALAYVETVDLTRSFGWDGHEAYQQHDVQELTRVLFDALDASFRNNNLPNPITPLYEVMFYADPTSLCTV
jgi:ubiquitin carboxyl-terminal hydrolase 47